MISEYNSRKIKSLSFVCAMMVAAMHWCLTCEVRAVGSLDWWVQELVSQNFTRIAVPFFFVVSGYFVCNGFPDKVSVASIGDWWWKNLRKRLVSLGIPYVFWCAAGLVLHGMYLEFVTGEGAWLEFGSPRWWWRVFGPHPKYAFQLWFVKSLMEYVAISPLLVLAAKRIPVLWLGALFLASLLIDAPYTILQGVFFFSAGMAMRFHGKGLMERMPFNRLGRFLPLALVFLWVVAVVSKIWLHTIGRTAVLGWVDIYGLHLNFMFAINVIGVAAVWTVYDCIKLPKMPSGGFFLFCMHVTVLPWAGWVVSRIPFVCDKVPLEYIIGVPFLIGVCMATRSLLAKFVPRFFGLVSGGR